jgi:uncharacterized protein (DUF1501 family)
MPFTRRSFLGRSLAMAGASAVLPGVMVRGLLAPRTALAAPSATRSLVLLRLYGGNDGLNTVIPYGSGAYYDSRPTLAVPANQVLAIDGQIGLHPRMAALKSHYDAGRLAIVQGVGYPDPSLSHFRSEVIWQNADPVGLPSTGWIGRWLDAISPQGDPMVRGIDVNWGLDPLFDAERANVFAVPNLDNLGFPTDWAHWEDVDLKRSTFEAISQQARAVPLADTMAARGYVLSRNVDLYAGLPRDLMTTFPDTNLGRGLATVSQMIAAQDAGTIAAGVYQVGIGGFDTHAKQDDPGGHPDIWGEISGALAAFHAEMTARGNADDVLVVTYSEFGRRVEENGSTGTDHGTAAPMFAFGNPVAGGVYGANPDLADVDEDGNLNFATDFREVYATVLSGWLGADAGQTDAILGGTYTPVPFLA